MSKYSIDFGSVQPVKNEDTKSQKLALAIGNTFTPRPLGEPFAYYLAYIHESGKPFRTIIPKDAEEFESRTGVPCRRRYAINVLDREDKTIRILEGSIGLFNQLRILEMAEHKRKVVFSRPWWQRILAVGRPQWVEKKWPSPAPYGGLGSTEGMKITVRVSGDVGKPMTIRYTVTGVRDTLTNAERDMAKVGMLDLSQLYKPTEDQMHPLRHQSNLISF